MSRFLERELKGRQSIWLKSAVSLLLFLCASPVKEETKVRIQAGRPAGPEGERASRAGEGSARPGELLGAGGAEPSRAGTRPGRDLSVVLQPGRHCRQRRGALGPRPPACLHSPATAAATAELDSQKFSFWGHFEPTQGWEALNKIDSSTLLAKPCPAGSERAFPGRSLGCPGRGGSPSAARNFPAGSRASAPSEPPRRAWKAEGTWRPPRLQSCGEARQETEAGSFLASLSSLPASGTREPPGGGGKRKLPPCGNAPRASPSPAVRSPSPDSRVPSKRVAMVSRKVFWGANNPFITGIFPARCEVPHQSLSPRVAGEESAEGARGKVGREEAEG